MLEWFKSLFRRRSIGPLLIIAIDEEDAGQYISLFPDMVICNEDFEDYEVQGVIYEAYHERQVVAIVPDSHSIIHVPHDMPMLVTSAFSAKQQPTVH